MAAAPTECVANPTCLGTAGGWVTILAAGFFHPTDATPFAMNSRDEIEHWLQTTVIYGLAFVFLSIFCAIVLWIFWRISSHGVSVIGTLREWLPQWFQAQIESHQAVVQSAHQLTESLGGVHEKVDDTQRGLHHTVAAVRMQAKKHQDWDSDAMLELDRAAMILKPKE